MNNNTGIGYQFLEFRFLPDQARLLHGSEDIHLPPKALHFLNQLLSAGNTLVSRDMLFQLLWQGRQVSDESLAQVVAQCRRALGDSAAQQKIIKTVPKLGFRLVPEITQFSQSSLQNIES